MKKTLFVCAACISIVVVQAQDNRSAVAPPPPPPPPFAMVAPPPPPPPPPPVPPVAPGESVETVHSTNTIINELGNEISVHTVKGIHTVFITKNGKTQKIKLSTWNANRKYYEKKYGQLPPPPPPPPAVETMEEPQFSAPVIIKDSNS